MPDPFKSKSHVCGDRFATQRPQLITPPMALTAIVSEGLRWRRQFAAK